jgi:hypothetical protein
MAQRAQKEFFIKKLTRLTPAKSHPKGLPKQVQAV